MHNHGSSRTDWRISYPTAEPYGASHAVKSHRPVLRLLAQWGQMAFDRRIMKTIHLLRSTVVAAFFLAAVPSPTQTSAPRVSLPDTERRMLTSKKMGQKYDLLVSLPEDYAKSGRSYPVLYVLDGWHFPLMAFLQSNNQFSNRMRPVIIVNVSQGLGPDVMALRARDFTPTKASPEPTSGGAPAFLDFLEHEVIPFVDRTYRTIPSDRGLLGHSYGGLFAIYVLEQRPALFQRIVAASPYLGWDNRILLTEAQKRLRTLPKPMELDLSAGDDDLPGLAAATEAFAKLLGELKLAGLDYRFILYPGQNHNSVRLVSFPAGLYWVYRPEM